MAPSRKDTYNAGTNSAFSGCIFMDLFLSSSFLKNKLSSQPNLKFTMSEPNDSKEQNRNISEEEVKKIEESTINNNCNNSSTTTACTPKAVLDGSLPSPQIQQQNKFVVNARPDPAKNKSKPF